MFSNIHCYHILEVYFLPLIISITDIFACAYTPSYHAELNPFSIKQTILGCYKVLPNAANFYGFVNVIIQLQKCIIYNL